MEARSPNIRGRLLLLNDEEGFWLREADDDNDGRGTDELLAAFFWRREGPAEDKGAGCVEGDHVGREEGNDEGWKGGKVIGSSAGTRIGMEV